MQTRPVDAAVLALLVLALAVRGAGNAKGTYWSTQTDPGGCSLPEADYQVTDAVALGQSGALGDLKWEAGMCGQVLNVNCGGKSVSVIVASTCNVGSDSCGVDMIKSTWDKATSGASPGIVACSVSLSLTNPFKDPHMVCYNRPNTAPSPYYVNLGVMNTGGEVVKSAKIDGVPGANSNGAWFAFNAQGGQLFHANATVEFTFASGKRQRFHLGDCKNSTGVHIFK